MIAPSTKSVEDPKFNVETSEVAPFQGVDNDSKIELLQCRSEWSMHRKISLLLQDARFVLPLWLVDQASLILPAYLIFALVASLTSSTSMPGKLIFTLAALGTLIFRASKLYPGIGLHPVLELRKAVLSTGLVFFTTILTMLISGNAQSEVILTLTAGGFLSLITVPVVRNFARTLLGRTNWWPQPVLLFSNSENSKDLADQLSDEPGIGWKPIGVVDINSSVHSGTIGGMRRIRVDQIQSIAEAESVFWGLIDGPRTPIEKHGTVWHYHHQTLPRLVALDVSAEFPSLWANDVYCADVPGKSYQNQLRMVLPVFAKRLFDIFASLLLLTVFSPFLVLSAFLVRITARGPVFYAQPRPGRQGFEFKIWKFRSMVQNAEAVLEKYLNANPERKKEWELQHKLSYDPRITTIGRILRKTSLDELPQLWNVLKGDMSLVGPRPLQIDEIAKYGDVFQLYIRVRPGITGMWQINGRNNTDYSRRLFYVKYYTHNWSLWLDWYILLRTVRVVVLCEGAR